MAKPRATAARISAERDGPLEVPKRPDGAESPARAPGWRKPLNLLIVEDDEDLLDLLSVAFLERGHRVQGFTSGEESLRSDFVSEVDVVLTDYNLLGMNGTQLCRELLSRRPGLPIVIMTSEGGTDKAIAALRQGAADYLLKPTTPDAVEHVLRRAVGEAKRRERLRRRDARVRLTTGETIRGTPYRLERWLGEGGMGTVFEAQHTDIERQVALKILHADHCESPSAVQTFRNEARASARIGAANIVEILDFQELEDGRLMFAMEFLAGQDLHQAMKAPDMDISRMIGIMRQVCRGLGAAHAAGVVHRDIKPENIMLVEREGRRDFVKLVDFGIAAFLTEADDPASMAGTPQYMAPELLRGEAIDGRVDMYAIGCMFYEFIVGETPFAGTVHEILEGQLERTPELPSARVSDVHPALDALIMRCLEKTPENRYADMADLEAALCELQIRLAVSTTWDDLALPDVAPERLEWLADNMPDARVGKRRRFLPALIVTAVLVALGSVAATWMFVARDTSSVEDEVSQHVRRARDAAALSHYVYPPAEEPDGRTALREILVLESLGSRPAHRRAHDLRLEFSETLVRLGDRYWGRTAGRAFAIEYYVMALLFDPTHPRADRAIVSPVALDGFREKAERGGFSSAELQAAAPLVALAEQDPETREAALEELRNEPGQSATVLSMLDHVAPPPAERRRSKKSQTRPSEPALEEATPSPQPAIAAVAEVPAEPVAEPLPSSPRDPDLADDLAAQAEAAARSGHTNEALQLFHRALDASPRNLAALDGLSGLYFDQSDYPRAVQFAEKAARRGSTATRWLHLGDGYFKVLRYTDALSAYETAQSKGSKAAAGRIAKVEAKLGR